MSKIYVTSTNEEYWSACEEYTSLEEALKNAANDHGLSEGDPVYIGVKQEFELQPIDGESLVESLICGAEEKLGDWSESWESIVLACPHVKAFAELKIRELVGFINKEHPATFFTVEDVRQEITTNNPPTMGDK
jgi:hypothetical protein